MEGKDKSKIIEEGELSVPRGLEKQRSKPPPPFLQNFKEQKEEEYFSKFVELLKHGHINFPFA